MKRAALLTAAVIAGPLAACAPRAEPVATTPPPPVAVALANPPSQFQFLYGSAEAAALSRQAFRALTLKATTRSGQQGDSVVLAADATLAAPRWVDCGAKPRAAVFDADETVILNLGVEELAARDPARPFDERQWDRWERTGDKAVVAVPGAIEAFAALRRAGVTPILNTNRATLTATGTGSALKAAGLGDFELGKTMFLRDGPSGKDPRRATISARWCVVAMAGDQLGDFSDLFNAIKAPAERRRAADTGPIADLWGNGWFVLPNPVYGSALKGGFDDVFPTDKRWVDPGATNGVK